MKYFFPVPSENCRGKYLFAVSIYHVIFIIQINYQSRKTIWRKPKVNVEKYFEDITFCLQHYGKEAQGICNFAGSDLGMVMTETTTVTAVYHLFICECNGFCNFKIHSFSSFCNLGACLIGLHMI